MELRADLHLRFRAWNSRLWAQALKGFGFLIVSRDTPRPSFGKVSCFH